jgi:hypothetical protein
MTTSNERLRRPLLGYFLVIVSYMLMLAELTLLLLYALSNPGSMLEHLGLFAFERTLFGRLLFLLLLVMCFVLLLRIFRIGKRLLIRTAEETIATDPRPYVLYLRAFNADVPASSVPEHGDPDKFSWWLFQFPLLTAIRFISPRLLFAPPLTEEEQIVRAFNDIGPVIAVGSPGEATPRLGASRLYIAEEEWQTRVSELVRNAGAVVIRISQKSQVAPQSILAIGSSAGLTPGLQWEVATVPREVPPDRLFFLIAANDEVYGQFSSLVHGAFPRGLPPFCDAKQRPGRVRGVIGFDGDWQPRLFPMSASATSVFRLTRYPVTTAIRERLRAMRERRQPRSPWLSLSGGVLATVLFAGFFLVVVTVGVPVPAANLMVMIPPSTIPVPLLKAQVPVFLSGLVESAEVVMVTVSIGAAGTVLNVRTRAKNPAAAAFVENTVKKWRFLPVRVGMRLPAVTTFNYPVRPLVFATPVLASNLMVLIPPSTIPVPLLKAQFPIAPPGLVKSAEVVIVTVSIGAAGTVLNVRTRAKSPAAAAFVQNTVKKWRVLPVRAGMRLPPVTTFNYPVRPLVPANPARRPVGR